MLEFATVSKNGDRQYNEDCLKTAFENEYRCFIICDGLGGYECGDVASKIVAETFVNELADCENLTSFLTTAFCKAQKQVVIRQKTIGAKNMKTTAVCLVTNDTELCVGHIGDSRFYGFKKDGTYIRTFDHSVPQLLVQSGVIKEDEIRNHPNRNMLLKALGDNSDESLFEVTTLMSLNDFSAFLLCSDGFWELIDENEMLSTLESSISPQEWMGKMTAIVEKNGKEKDMDNYSAIAIINK